MLRFPGSGWVAPVLGTFIFAWGGWPFLRGGFEEARGRRAGRNVRRRGQQRPALARVDIGIAIGAGTDVAIESAGVVLAQSDPRAVLGVVELSKAGYEKMLQNLFWAAGYNVVAIPLAAGVLAPAGILLSPAVGAVLMNLSTIIVALNAQLLKHLDLRPSRA